MDKSNPIALLFIKFAIANTLPEPTNGSNTKSFRYLPAKLSFQSIRKEMGKDVFDIPSPHPLRGELNSQIFDGACPFELYRSG